MGTIFHLTPHFHKNVERLSRVLENCLVLLPSLSPHILFPKISQHLGLSAYQGIANGRAEDHGDFLLHMGFNLLNYIICYLFFPFLTNSGKSTCSPKLQSTAAPFVSSLVLLLIIRYCRTHMVLCFNSLSSDLTQKVLCSVRIPDLIQFFACWGCDCCMQ